MRTQDAWLLVQALGAVVTLALSVWAAGTLAAVGWVVSGGLLALCAGANLGARGVSSLGRTVPGMAAQSPRERLLAKLADPSTPPFEGAVALSCVECGVHLTWCGPPAPSVPVVCAEHAGPGRLVAAW